MKNRLSRFMPQGSAMAFTAMAVALMNFHGQSSIGNSPASSPDAKVVAHGIRHVSGTRSGLAGGVTKVDFDPDLLHTPWVDLLHTPWS